MQYKRTPVLLDLDTHGSRCGTVSTAITEDDIVFHERVSIQMSRRTTMSRTFNTLGNDTADVFFNHLDFRRTITVAGDRAVLSRIMQIVTSAVRVICACIVSRVSHGFPAEQGLGHQVGQVHPSEADNENKL